MEAKIKTKNLKQSRTFSAVALDVYEAIMDSRTHAKFTGAPAKISTKVGGKHSAHGGYCEGVNLELKPGKKIVQIWRGSNWPEGYYSTITYSLTSAGKGKTRLSFTHNGIPETELESIKKGWIAHYWQPMEQMFTGQTIVHPTM
jgi:activator of HSP90 ATPase